MPRYIGLTNHSHLVAGSSGGDIALDDLLGSRARLLEGVGKDGPVLAVVISDGLDQVAIRGPHTDPEREVVAAASVTGTIRQCECRRRRVDIDPGGRRSGAESRTEVGFGRGSEEGEDDQLA